MAMDVVRGGEESMIYGYHGRVLRVNLSTGQLSDQPLPEGLARQYLGGSGIIDEKLERCVPCDNQGVDVPHTCGRE